jgi:hypothetical protein
MKLMAGFEKVIMRSPKYRFKKVEPYRLVSFDPTENIPKTFMDKFLTIFFKKMLSAGKPDYTRFLPSPDDLKKSGLL